MAPCFFFTVNAVRTHSDRSKVRVVMIEFTLTVIVAIIAIGLDGYIYRFPILNDCNWAKGGEVKLMAFGDPQIPGYPLGTDFKSRHKQLDVWGNDKYLKHTVGVYRRHLEPEHVAVLGDLISSQWIDDTEFKSRAERFTSIFPSSDNGMIHNISGNHDIGYHGDFNDDRLSRYAEYYGALNFENRYKSPDGHDWRLIGINSLALDGPPNDSWREETVSFLKSVQDDDFQGATVLLSHLPLYKPSGICRDGPFLAHYDDGRLREQNHLSAESSQLVLGIFSPHHGGIIVTGHDHEGCVSSYNTDLSVQQGIHEDSLVVEATVRSVMGEFGGNAGLVTGVWDSDANKLRFKFDLCRFQVQHIWWVTHVLNCITILCFSLFVLGLFRGKRPYEKPPPRRPGEVRMPSLFF